MTNKKRRLNELTKNKKSLSDTRMPINDQARTKKSLGMLRTHEKTKPKSPDATGKLRFQRHTLEAIYEQLNESGDEEVVCNIAAWKNRNEDGAFLTVEVSPQFIPYGRQMRDE